MSAACAPVVPHRCLPNHPVPDGFDEVVHAAPFGRMHTLNSSLRSISPEATLALARPLAERLGISRVTDTTRLDRIGIPVFASVRPAAVAGSLCVNAGKGIRVIEAQVGAYMEAIEFAIAEQPGPHHDVRAVDPRQLLGGCQSVDAIADLCPSRRKGVDFTAPLECVDAEDIVHHTNVLVPAELVFVPYVPRTGAALFGSSTNGLASGNTIAEATLHGLLEVIERDVKSFNHVRHNAKRVAADSLPNGARELLSMIESAGLFLCVRAMPNGFKIPMFEAHLYDPAAVGPIAVMGGYGCHVVPEIALTRAITEAVQSRLTTIHGGRDDLIRFAVRTSIGGPGDLERRAAVGFRTLMESPDVIDFDEVEVGVREPANIDDAIERTIERLLECGVERVCRVVLTEPHEALHVVRVIVPKLEFFNRDLPRMGPRLLGYMHDRVA